MRIETEDCFPLPFESEDQFDRTYERYYPALVGFFMGRGVSREDSRELAQEAFLRLYRSRTSFKGECLETTWIYKIADNVWKNRLRYLGAEKRQREDVPLEWEHSSSMDRPVTADACHLESVRHNPLKTVLRGERRRLLRQAVSELAPRMRQCIRLRLFHDLTYREIAETMQISVETVKPLLHQAKVRLRKMLRQNWSDTEF